MKNLEKILQLESLTNMVNNEDIDKRVPLSMSRGYVIAPPRDLTLFRLRKIYKIII